MEVGCHKYLVYSAEEICWLKRESRGWTRLDREHNFELLFDIGFIMTDDWPAISCDKRKFLKNAHDFKTINKKVEVIETEVNRLRQPKREKIHQLGILVLGVLKEVTASECPPKPPDTSKSLAGHVIA